MTGNSARKVMVFAILLALATPLYANDGYNEAVETCLSSVNAELDLDSATRVRHLVEHVKGTGIGDVFEIRTSVFTPGKTRTFAAYCVAGGSNLPVKFRISETGA